MQWFPDSALGFGAEVGSVSSSGVQEHIHVLAARQGRKWKEVTGDLRPGIQRAWHCPYVSPCGTHASQQGLQEGPRMEELAPEHGSPCYRRGASEGGTACPNLLAYSGRARWLRGQPGSTCWGWKAGERCNGACFEQADSSVERERKGGREK